MVAMARCLLKARGMPAAFWGEAVNTAVFILNRCPTKALRGETPYEAWHGSKPAVHFLRTFGCLAHVKVTRPHAKKLDDRSIKMVFVGYEPGSKAYRVYDPLSGRLHITRDVVFDESKGWNWSSTAEPATDDTFTVEYPVTAVSVADEPATTPSPTPSPAPTPAAKGAGHTGGLRLSANPHPIWDRSGRRGRTTSVPAGDRLHQHLGA